MIQKPQQKSVKEPENHQLQIQLSNPGLKNDIESKEKKSNSSFSKKINSHKKLLDFDLLKQKIFKETLYYGESFDHPESELLEFKRHEFKSQESILRNAEIILKSIIGSLNQRVNCLPTPSHFFSSSLLSYL